LKKENYLISTVVINEIIIIAAIRVDIRIRLIGV